ncbi:MAG: hypothetical protein V3V78_03835 [Candidatus Woesearchaeota archaeon]
MKYPNMQKLAQAYFSDSNYQEHIRLNYKNAEQILSQTEDQIIDPWDSTLFDKLIEIFERKGIMAELGEETFAITRMLSLSDEHKSKIERIIPELLKQLENPKEPFAEIFAMPTRCY